MKEYESLEYQDSKEILNSTILGFFIGLAVIVPGISGSTMAIIFKLYDKLLYAIGNILKKFKLCFIFLIPIVLGAFLGFGLGFFAIQKLLKVFPFAIVAFFGGLMIGAFPAISYEIKEEKVTLPKALLFLLGLGIPLAISITSTFIRGGNQSFEDIKFYHYLLFIVIGYMIAITQVVPGLSATAILMAFGYFIPLMESVSLTYIKSNPMIIGIYLCLIIGFVIGMISFSGFLTKVFDKNRKLAFFMIVGLSLGSILSMFFNPDIYETYQSWVHGNMSFGLDLGFGILLFIIGILIAASFLKYEKRQK
ncbi:MAG: DUF368 domain-containing protein [Roseburia sp.]|nr:DUF368 domain-containing protein [Anaeroplasma bactoclasticum]MCM1195837.1 DUF368 domain-containing protein [Roseburia sp.]MCM1556308.1 DUF368 domain-containing protein [Anaeroplasma bactoclasticum]